MTHDFEGPMYRQRWHEADCFAGELCPMHVGAVRLNDNADTPLSN